MQKNICILVVAHFCFKTLNWLMWSSWKLLHSQFWGWSCIFPFHSEPLLQNWMSKYRNDSNRANVSSVKKTAKHPLISWQLVEIYNSLKWLKTCLILYIFHKMHLFAVLDLNSLFSCWYLQHMSIWQFHDFVSVVTLLINGIQVLLNSFL